MVEDSKVDLGSIQIHKKVIADIAVSALEEIDGVQLADRIEWVGYFCDLAGYKHYPNVHVMVGKDNQVSIEIKVKVRYGINMSDVAGKVQDVVRTAVERTADINLRDVNVNIQGIERG